MKKYCDYYFTTKCHKNKEIAKGIWSYHYSWHIRNEKGDDLESSLSNEEGEQYYESKEVAEQQAKEAIQYYYL